MIFACHLDLLGIMDLMKIEKDQVYDKIQKGMEDISQRVQRRDTKRGSKIANKLGFQAAAPVDYEKVLDNSETMQAIKAQLEAL